MFLFKITVFPDPCMTHDDAVFQHAAPADPDIGADHGIMNMPADLCAFSDNTSVDRCIIGDILRIDQFAVGIDRPEILI